MGFCLDIGCKCTDGVQILNMGYRDGILSGYLGRIHGVCTVHGYKDKEDGILR